MSVNRITTTALYNGASVIQNVFYLKNPDGAIQLPAVATEIRDGWLGIIKNFAAASCVWTSIRVDEVATATPKASANLAINVPGLGNSFTQHVCLSFVLRWATGIGGRHGRGRMFIGAPRPDWITNSLPTAAGLTAINGTFIPQLKARYITPASSGLFLLVVRKGDPSNNVLVTDVSVAPTLGIQRRRNIGVGI